MTRRENTGNVSFQDVLCDIFKKKIIGVFTVAAIVPLRFHYITEAIESI